MKTIDSRRVTVPEGELDGLRVERFAIGENNLQNLLAFGRSTRPGTYTKLLDGPRLWMSDTDAEIRDHMDAMIRIEDPATRSVLINGLGLGMVVKAAVDTDHVERIDVVESDRRVIDLVGPHYTDDPRVTIHHGDAYEITWPRGTSWDVVWSDIWPDLCTDNLDGMAKLRRRYARRSAWHGCWGRELLIAQRNRDRRQGW